MEERSGRSRLRFSQRARRRAGRPLTLTISTLLFVLTVAFHQLISMVLQ